MSDQKPPFVFNNYPLLHLLKLITASPLINSYPMQMQKALSDDVCCFLCSFLPSLICMCVFTLHGFTWLLAWKYVTICNISSLRAAIFFQSKNISCMRSICAEVSGDFHYIAPISWSQIWHVDGARFCRVLLCRSAGYSSDRFPAFHLHLWYLPQTSTVQMNVGLPIHKSPWPPSRYWMMCHFRLPP